MSKNVPKVLRIAVLALNHLGLALTVVALILEHFFTRTVRLDGFATELVLDPWRGWVLAGMAMMMAGAVGLMFIAPRPAGKKQFVRILAWVVPLAAVFLCITLRKVGPFVNNPNPSLQSPYFAPHVVMYMFAYSLLAAATVMAAIALVKGDDAENRLALQDWLVYAGSAFLTIGMLIGAIWAREAWGSFWSWDPKETWAFITWLDYLVYLHLRKAAPRRRRAACLLLILAFLCLQMCWWGVNLLPAVSVHTYNR